MDKAGLQIPLIIGSNYSRTAVGIRPSRGTHEYGIEIINGGTKAVLKDHSAIILAVAHNQFKSWPIQKSANQVVFDVKSVPPKKMVDARL
jgi:UDP-N-acetyl-D-galactosamine dehydrogenase